MAVPKKRNSIRNKKLKLVSKLYCDNSIIKRLDLKLKKDEENEWVSDIYIKHFYNEKIINKNEN